MRARIASRQCALAVSLLMVPALQTSKQSAFGSMVALAYPRPVVWYPGFRSDIKIDRSFVHGIEDCRDAQSIVSAVINLGHTLGASITAEGVETRQQLNYLREQGCDELQGFFFSKSVAPANVVLTIRRLGDAAKWWSDRFHRAS